MIKKMKIASLLLVVYAGISCQKNLPQPPLTADAQADKINVFKGPQMELGAGKVRSWAAISHSGVPTELGLEFTPGAINGLPAEGDLHLSIPLHKKATEATPYKHVALSWSAAGHQPPNIFGVSHFDAHFMRIEDHERMMIPEYSPGSGHDQLPPADYRPAGFIPLPGGIQAMGKHWGSMPFPAPGTFTSVMIYGSYGGNMIFEEPMVAVSHMLAGGASNLAYGQPAKFHQAGYYPTKYNVYTTPDGNYHITLSGFVWRNAN